MNPRTRLVLACTMLLAALVLAASPTSAGRRRKSCAPAATGPQGEVVQINGLDPITQAPGVCSSDPIRNVAGNAGETVASVCGKYVHAVWQAQRPGSNPPVYDAKLLTRHGGTCEPEIQVSVDGSETGASHDAPSVFVDGQGYVYVTYQGASNETDGPRIRKSQQATLPETFGPEVGTRLYSGGETHGFTGADGWVYLIGHNMHTWLDVIVPNALGGVIAYKDGAPGPRHVVANNSAAFAYPPGGTDWCDGNPASETAANRFTKGYITEGILSDGSQILLALWGWGNGNATCPDIRLYPEDSHEVFFAYSTDGGATWWNRAGTQSRTAPICVGSGSLRGQCNSGTAGIQFNDPAFILTPTRQRQFRAAWYDTESATIYVSFAKSLWCNSGICLWQNVTNPGALMFLRFQLGSDPVFETQVHGGSGVQYDHVPVLRKGPDGSIYLYAVHANGSLYQHVSSDEGASWSSTNVVPFVMGRAHGQPDLLKDPDTLLIGGGLNNGPFYLFRRTW